MIQSSFIAQCVNIRALISSANQAKLENVWNQETNLTLKVPLLSFSILNSFQKKHVPCRLSTQKSRFHTKQTRVYVKMPSIMQRLYFHTRHKMQQAAFCVVNDLIVSYRDIHTKKMLGHTFRCEGAVVVPA